MQINFGVVLTEGDEPEVKITVIATGFERSNLPLVERRIPVTRVTVIDTPVPPQVSSQEPKLYVTENNSELLTEFVPPPAPVQATSEPAEPTAPSSVDSDAADDLDTPAFMRRERRLFR